MSRQQYEFNNEFMLMYNKNFDDFSLNAIFGGNTMYRRYEYVYGETQGGLAIPLFYNLKNSITPAFSYNLLRPKRIDSVYGNFTLGWRSMFYLDGSIRNDWSSTLPAGSNSYLYPAVTGSFIFSELVKDNFPWLNFGKVRLGYAMVGNDTDPFRVYDTYTQYTTIDSETGTPGYIPNATLNNPDLKPEKTNSYEAGLEMNFFLNRLGFDVTVYSSESRNQIIPLSVTGTTGYNFRVINSGLITNKGIEFALNGVPVRTNNFTWTSTLTLASNRNKVVELVEGTDYYRLAAAPFKVEIGALVGAPFGTIMGTDFIYDAKGNRVVDEDGFYLQTTGNVNIGKIFPDFIGGWSNTFRYRNIDLSVLLDFSKGGNYFSTSYMWGMYSGMLEETAANNVRENGFILKGVKEDGTPNDIAIDADEWGMDFYVGPSAQSVFKSDYVKLREINVGYTFPLKRDAFLQSLRVSAYGRNLAVWGPDTKHFDPEMVVSNSGNVQGIEGGAIPSIANYGINISVNF
jgi:outer membrane receptor protein involved in Fe transport